MINFLKLLRKSNFDPRGADFHGGISLRISRESVRENRGEITEDKREIRETETKIWNKKIVQTWTDDGGRVLSNIEVHPYQHVVSEVDQK